VSVGRGLAKREYIMTAQHVPDMMGWNSDLYIINKGTTTAVTHFQFINWKIKIKTTDNDMIFFEVPADFKCRTGLKSAPLSSSAPDSGYIKIYTPFPNGKLGYHTGEYRKHPSGQIGKYMHRVSTINGTSGSPVFCSGKIIGCHSGHETLVDVNVFHGVSIPYTYLSCHSLDPRQFFNKEAIINVPRTILSKIPIFGPLFHNTEMATQQLIQAECESCRKMKSRQLTLRETTEVLSKAPELLWNYETDPLYHRKGKRMTIRFDDPAPGNYGSARFYHDNHITDVFMSDDGYEEHETWNCGFESPDDMYDLDDSYYEIEIATTKTAKLESKKPAIKALNRTTHHEAIISRSDFPSVEEYWNKANSAGYLKESPLRETKIGTFMLNTRLPPGPLIEAELDEALSLELPKTVGYSPFITWEYLKEATDLTPERPDFNKLWKVGDVLDYKGKDFSTNKKLKDVLKPGTEAAIAFKEKYPRWKLHEKYQFPPTGAKAIVDSLKAHTGRRAYIQRPSKKALRKCTNFIKKEYGKDPRSLRPRCFNAEGFDEQEARTQLCQWIELGGWKKTGGAGVPYNNISTTCKTHGDVAAELGTEKLIELVIGRIKRAIQYKGGSEITALMLFEAGLCDPTKVFIKNEPHKMSKIVAERYRLISSISTVDCLVHRLLYYTQNKEEIANWKYVPSSSGLDMATEEGKAEIRKVITELRIALSKHQQSLGEMDVSAFDWSLPEWLLHYENDLRLELMELPKDKWLDYRKVCNVMKYTLTRSLYVDSEGGMYVAPHGIQKSGHTNTSSTNSRISTILCFLSGSMKSRSNGDDALLGISGV
jgi:hypothetical protein